MTSLLTTPLVLLAAFAPALVAQQPDAQPLTEDQRALFALLDEFDPLDTSKLPFVRFEIDHGRAKSVWHGFLLASDDESFSVQTLPIGQRLCATFQRRPGAPFVGSFKPATLADVEAAMLAVRDEDRMGSAAPEWLVLARAYARRGHIADVHRLWNDVPALRGNSREQVRAALAQLTTEWLNEDFVDPSLSWQQLLARHDLWLARFGGIDSRCDEHVHRNRRGIEEVLGAKAERAKRRTNGAPTPADLVFDLHDEFWVPVTERSEGLECGRLPPRDGDTPLRRVKAAGLACVPDLIAALGDRSLTRTVRGSSRRMVTVPIGRFGDVAEAALVEIAGLTPTGDDRQKAWTEWYEQAKSSSPEAVSEQRIDELDPEAVSRYLDGRPERFERVLKAIDAAADPARQASGVRAAVRSLPRPLPATLLDRLARVVADERDGSDQVSSAKVLLEHGRSEVVDAVAKAWLDAVRGPASPSRTGAESQAEFLMKRDASAWKTLEEGCRHPEGRRSVAWVLAFWPFDCATVAKGPAAPSLLQCLEMLAIDESLLNRAVETTFEGRKFRLQTVTIADVAAARLAECWPDEHRFDPTQTISVRRAQRQDIRFGRGFARTRREPPLPPNLVTKITFDDSAASLPAEARAAIDALQQKEMSPALLHDTALAVARSSKGRTLVLDCERTGLGEGTIIHVSWSDEEPASLCRWSSGNAEETRAWQVTIGGAADERSGPQALADFANDGKTGNDLDDAFGALAATGVEVRYVMRVN